MVRQIVWSALLLLASAAPARAHPGVGIVADRQGNVFYTDLIHVWRVAPDGRRSIAVRDVHTHELMLDARGNLLGEDSEYLGGDRWRHRVWQRSPDGRVTDVVPWRDGFEREYGLVRDHRGASYWTHCRPEGCAIRRRSPDGRTATLAAGERLTRHVTRINWIAVTAEGAVYYPDGRDLRRLEPGGRVVTAAPGLAPPPARPGDSALHLLFGIWPDERGGVYVANMAGRVVQRVDPAGGVEVVARSEAPWAPTGVTRAPDGALWVLEYNSANEARARRVVDPRAPRR